jgi:hypothetical protein
MPGCGLLAFRPAWPRGNAVASGRFRCVAVKATGSQLGAVGFRLLACCGRGAGMIGGADNVAACALYDVDVARDGTCRRLTGTPGTYVCCMRHRFPIMLDTRRRIGRHVVVCASTEFKRVRPASPGDDMIQHAGIYTICILYRM